MGTRSRPEKGRFANASLASTERLGKALTTLAPASSRPRVRASARPRARRERSEEQVCAALLERTGTLVAGKYRLLGPLAQGGMGTIWRAEHVLLGCSVALKLIDARVPLRSEARLRFLREARTAAALRGAHVVQLLDYGLDQEAPYLVMELLAGESLRERLLRVGCLSKRETLRVVTQVARALSRAHKLCIVHRDVSPNNVFLAEEDGTTSVKLLDFGIAKWVSECEPRDRTLTLNGMILGTPSYMSPEQLEGAGVDSGSDIWALGVIAFECLLGFVPFRSETFAGLVLAICSRPLPEPSRLARLPQAFDAWFQRACARERARRFATVQEAASALRRALLAKAD